MKFDEIKNKSQSELKELLAGAQAKVRDSRFQAHHQQLKNIRLIRQNKKMIAKILTALSSRDMQTMAPAA